jgi:hypothetical protein
MKTTTAVKSAAKIAVNDEREPVKLQKRIGSTVFTVNVRFSDKSAETLEDKILRLIEREVRNADIS